jgi:Protein of unknown function (DUF3179)
LYHGDVQHKADPQDYDPMKKPRGANGRNVELSFLICSLLGAGTVLAAQNPSTLSARTASRQLQTAKPVSVPAHQVTFLKDSNTVIGVSLNGSANAYWLPMVISLHQIQDRLGGIPILVTWCSLCNTGLVFRPAADGRQFTFDVTGTNGMNLVLKDRQTGTSWQQATGEAFDGPLKGSRLPLLPFEITSWGKWKEEHPNTSAFQPEPADEEKYSSDQDQYSSIMQLVLTQRIWQIQPAPDALRGDPRLLPHKLIIGLEVGDAQRAYPVELIHENLVINDEVAASPVLIVYEPSTDTITAFSRLVKGRTLEFKLGGKGEVTDSATGSEWNSEGLCVRGALKGLNLKRLTPLLSFWFAWAEFHPATSVYQPSTDGTGGSFGSP